MNHVVQFVVLLLMASAAMALIGALLGVIDARVRHWPGLWATLLCLCVLVPLLSLALAQAPSLNPRHYLGPANWPLAGDVVGKIVLNLAEPRAHPAHGWWSQLKLWLAATYLLGVGIRLSRLALGRWRIAAIARAAVPATRVGRTRFWTCETELPPFAFTPLFRPRQTRIVIPGDFVRRFSAAELDSVLAHERAHIARRDDQWGVVLRMLCAWSWPSPFVQALFSRWAQSAEVQCDLAVTHGLAPQMRKAYAATLLKALHITANRVLAYPAASFSTNRSRGVQMRINTIIAGRAQAFNRRRHQLALAALTLTAGALGAVSLSANADVSASQATAGSIAQVRTFLTGHVTAPFGKTGDPFHSGQARVHKGVDVAAPVGTPIYAPADGVIVTATDHYANHADYGKVVVIETGKQVRTLFAHLQGYPVSEGQHVHKGKPIASVGNSGKSTGPHVHIETFVEGARVDPLSIWKLSDRKRAR